MNELLIHCTLCAVLAFVPLENIESVEDGRSLSSIQFGLYAGLGFPVSTWHSLLPLMGDVRYPSAYRTPPPVWETQPSLLLGPTMEDWTTSLVWNSGLVQPWAISPFFLWGHTHVNTLQTSGPYFESIHSAQE